MADLNEKDSSGSTKLVGANPSTSGESYYANVTASGELYTTFHQAAFDAFGRFRISNPKSVFDATFLIDKQPLLFSEQVAIGGTVTQNSNTANVEMATTTSSGSSSIFQSKQYIKYHPGKSQLILISAFLGIGKTNNRRRFGQFDSDNGYFFQINGETLSVCLRSNTSGSAVDTVIDQSSWNIDKLDGTGPSGITLDISKHNLFIIDYQWLGGGRIRYGFDFGGKVTYCHEILNANILSINYSKSAILPLRFENVNTGATASNTICYITCCCVISEGDYSPEGVLRRTSNQTTTKSVGGSGTLVPVLSLRKQSAYVNIPVKIQEVECFINSVDDSEFLVLINPTLTGASWSNVDGICQRDVTATALSGGTQIYGSYVRSSSSAPSVKVASEIFQLANAILGSDLAGASDIITIAVRNITSTSTALASITYKELL